MGYLRFGRGQGPVIWRGALSPAAQVSAFGLQALGLVGFSQLVPPVQMPVSFGPSPARISEQPHEHPPGSKVAADATHAAAKPLGLQARCPIDFDHSRRQEGKEVAGPKRVTRHPFLWGMALVGLGSALASPLATEVAFGVMPLAMAVIGGAHQDLRGRRSGALSPALDAKTSHLPFGALLAGQQQLSDVVDEFAWSNAAIAVAIAGGFAMKRRGAAAKQLLALTK